MAVMIYENGPGKIIARGLGEETKKDHYEKIPGATSGGVQKRSG